MRGHWLDYPEDNPERPQESEEISSMQRQEIKPPMGRCRS